MVQLDGAAPAIRWMAPELGADRSSLGNWRMSVGPPVVVSHEAQPGQPSDRLVVVNWNMHVGGGDIGGLLAEVRRRHGGAPVVFLLQEAYREGPEVPVSLEPPASFASMIRSMRPDGSREEIEAVATRLGLHAYYVPSMRNGAPAASAEDRGNAILSTLPLTDFTAIELPFERQRRVAVAATVAGVSHDRDAVEGARRVGAPRQHGRRAALVDRRRRVRPDPSGARAGLGAAGRRRARARRRSQLVVRLQ